MKLSQLKLPAGMAVIIALGDGQRMPPPFGGDVADPVRIDVYKDRRAIGSMEMSRTTFDEQGTALVQDMIDRGAGPQLVE